MNLDPLIYCALLAKYWFLLYSTKVSSDTWKLKPYHKTEYHRKLHELFVTFIGNLKITDMEQKN